MEDYSTATANTEIAFLMYGVLTSRAVKLHINCFRRNHPRCRRLTQAKRNDVTYILSTYATW